MRRGTTQRGYTIVEVMIFLAVSGLMFVIAASFINGKQASAEFKQGMNDINSQIREVINDVVDGKYPSNGDFTCLSSGGTISFPSGNQPQGTNLQCVFAGKIMQFGVDGTSQDKHVAYNVYSVAAKQYSNSANLTVPESFSEATPTIIDKNTVSDYRGLHWGVHLTAVYDGSASKSIGSVGFFSSFGKNGAAGLDSGSQTVVAVPIPTSASGEKDNQFIPKFNNPSMPSKLDAQLAAEPNPNIILCFTGGKGQYGSITIGGTNGQRLTTALKITNGTPPGICPSNETF